MAQAQYRTLSKRVLDRLSVNGKDAIFGDRDLAGFVMYDFIPLILLIIYMFSFLQ